MTVRPLTGAFFHCVIRLFIMNIALQFRPINVRLYVAYMADACFKFPECSPGNTMSRVVDGWESGNGHPYAKMWTRIVKWYDEQRMYELSDAEIVDMFNNARANGLTYRGCNYTGVDVMNAKRRWDDRLWARYERKRNGRRTMARLAVVPVMACFGIALPVDA